MVLYLFFSQRDVGIVGEYLVVTQTGKIDRHGMIVDVSDVWLGRRSLRSESVAEVVELQSKTVCEGVEVVVCQSL